MLFLKGTQFEFLFYFYKLKNKDRCKNTKQVVSQ